MACTIAIAACTDAEPELDDAPARFEAWKAELPAGFRPGTFLVEGDIPLRADELYDYWAFYAEGRRTDLWLVRPPGTTRRSVVHQVDDEDTTYPAPRKINLTYCVSDLFHGQKERIMRLLDQATNDWERHAHINFIYRPGYDADCVDEIGDGSTGVFFAVERVPIVGTGINAAGFFPHYAGYDRVLYITDEGWDRSDPAVLSTLRHELGHILGLRHEHALNPVICATGETAEDTRQLTPYDPLSIMHYDWCPGGTSQSGKEITRYDALGVRYLYNLPTHGRRVSLFGVPYPMFTDYNSDGRTDVSWFDNDVATVTIMAHGQPDGTFANLVTPAGGSPNWVEPFADYFTDTFGFSTDVFYHGPLDNPDRLFATEEVGGELLEANIQFYPVPLVGDFDGNSYADILWYQPGPTADQLWLFDGETFEARSLLVNGYYLPVVGDFSGDRRDDIFWYDPVHETSPIWRGTGVAPFFAQSTLDNAARGLPLDGSPFIPIPGDYNGDQRQDIFWYRAGTESDRMWLGGALTPANVSVAKTVDGAYRPIAADFDGDARTDVLWYASGKAKDSIWYITGTITWTDVPLVIAGDYAPFAGDFNGGDFAGGADLLWYQGFEATSPLWRSEGMVFTNMPEQATPSLSYPIGYGPIP